MDLCLLLDSPSLKYLFLSSLAIRKRLNAHKKDQSIVHRFIPFSRRRYLKNINNNNNNRINSQLREFVSGECVTLHNHCKFNILRSKLNKNFFVLFHSLYD